MGKSFKNRYAEWTKNNSDRIKRNYINDVGIDVKSLYTPLDLAGFDYTKDLGFPGEFPYTRGVTPEMHRNEGPNIRIYVGFGTSEDTNDRLHKLLKWGADEIQLAVDLPTQVGYDSDHIMATGEVGRVGVAVDSLQDMEEIFAGIPLNSFRRVSILGNSYGPVALALFIALGEKQGLKTSDYVVDLQNDILKEYIARGTQIYPVEPSVKLACDVVEYCVREDLKHWYPLTVCANHINATGAGSTVATAITLANARSYIEELLKRGLEVDDFASLLHMFLDERDDFFVALSNLRAARKVWANMLRNDYGAKKPESMALEVTSYAHGRETLKEPLNNIVRIAYAALAYYLGGVQFMYTASYDEAITLPSEEAVKIAIRTQQILAEELGFSGTVDPLGGSYYVEKLTMDIEKGITDELQKILELGGSSSCIENGYFERKIQEGQVRRQREFEEKKRISVGINKYESDEEVPKPTFKISEGIAEKQKNKLAKLREKRDNHAVRAKLQAVSEAAKNNSNVTPAVLEAVRAYATVGEICDVFRDIYGEYQRREVF